MVDLTAVHLRVLPQSLPYRHFPGKQEEAGRSDCLWEGFRLDFPHKAPEQPARRKKLDPIVIMGLGILIGGICVISLGMFLSRPDRSIPPYSIGAQEGSLVAVHVPPYTSDPEIKTLIMRFGDVGRATRDFADMKIRPTTPDDPRGRYQTATNHHFFGSILDGTG